MVLPAPWARRAMWWVFTPVLAAFVVAVSARDLAPAWEAHSGGGVPGTFVALEVHCRTDCIWKGTWTGPTGYVRDDVAFGSGGPDLSYRAAVPAVETDARKRVYPVGGGSDWLFEIAFVAVGAVLLVVWLNVRGLALGGLRRDPPRRPLS